MESNTNKIKNFLNNDRESIHIIKFLYKIKKHLMNFLGNLKQDLEFYTIIRENIDSVISKIEEILLFYDKIFLSLKSKHFGFFSQSEIDSVINCYLKLGELLNFIFEIYSNNIFLKLSILLIEKIHKSFMNLKNCKAQQLISALLYQCMVRFTEIITNKKIEFIDKFKDSKINYNLIKTINRILDFINISASGKNRDKNLKNFNNNNNNNSNNSKTFILEVFPNITEIFNYLLISRTNIFSLNAYFLFDDFSKTFYLTVKKLISALKNFNILAEKHEEIKAMLNINLFKLLEISRIKDDLKNSIEDSQHEFYLDSLNLYIKITKLIIKNFYCLEILADDSIKDKICRFLIELSFWDSLDVVENTCKFFLLIWKIAEKHKILMRSEIEKIIDFLFLRRFKLFISQIEESKIAEDSLVKLSVLETLVNYLVILVRDHNFVYLVYLNFDFCKIRFNLLIELLASCQKYFEPSLPAYSHLKSLITTLYLSVFEILYEVIINGNLGEKGFNKPLGASALNSDYEEDEMVKGFDFDTGKLNVKDKDENLNVNNNNNIDFEDEKNLKNSCNVQNQTINNNNNNNNCSNVNRNAKESKNSKKIKNKHCVSKKLKNTFASDLEESEVERKKSEYNIINNNYTLKTTTKNKDLNADNNNAKNNFCSESSEIEEEDNDYDVAEQPQNLNIDSESNETEKIKKEETNAKLLCDAQIKNQININANTNLSYKDNNSISINNNATIEPNTNNNENIKLQQQLQPSEEPFKKKFNLDFNFIKEIQHLQDLWNDEVLALVNLPSFKKFNNKICPLFGLSPIKTVHKKKGSGAAKSSAAAAAKETVLETKETENTQNLVSSASVSVSSNDNNYSSNANNDESANSSFVSNISDNNNSLNINIDIDPKAEKAAESQGAFEIINSSEAKSEKEEKSMLKDNEEKILSSVNNRLEQNNTNNNSINNININNKADTLVSQKALDAQRTQNYRKFAYSIAIMLKYSFYADIEKLNEIFGNKNDLSKLILEEYLNTFDFRGLDILKAYRIFVSTFKLTGESDNIYNMIIAFSEKYYQDNHNDANLRSSDEVSTLAYSILMLNTDLHDTSVKERMSIEDFIKNVYSTKYFDHVARSYLENIYKSILTNPFKVPCKRNDDYTKSDELFEVLKSKRNLVRNRQVFFEDAKKKHLSSLKLKENKAKENADESDVLGKVMEEEEEISKYLVKDFEGEVYLSDYDIGNSQKFLFEIFNFDEDKEKSKQESNKVFNKFNCLEIPKIKRSLNFSLFNLCENFNNEIDYEICSSKADGFNDACCSDSNFNFKVENKVISQETRNKVLSSIYYLLWEDVYYNFMEISSKFYERKDENVNRIFDKICVIADKLNKKDYIHKLIVN